MPRVSVCVATFRRPEGLRLLLEALAELRFETCAVPDVEVVVVDNEAGGPAASICAGLIGRFPWALRSLEEPRRGITFARNRCLASVRPDADFVAFIDDDEIPDPRWLEALLLAQQRHEADVVTGPVVPRFGPDVPRWVTRGDFFGPRRQPDGARLAVAFTNNVLLRAAIPRELGRGFDDQFALTGGEDTDFFMRVHKAGYQIVWASDAEVHETVPASRTCAQWIVRRGYREWGSHSRCERVLYPALSVRVARVAKASLLIGGGLAALPFAALLGRHRLVRALLTVSRGAGSLAGLLGHHYAEYRDPVTPAGAVSSLPSGRAQQ